MITLSPAKSTRISTLATNHANRLSHSRPRNTDLDPAFMRGLTHGDPFVFRGSHISMQVDPRGTIQTPGNDWTLHIGNTLLIEYMGHTFKSDGLGTIAFHFGAFMFSEYEPEKFGAVVIMSGGREPAQLFSKLGVLEIIEGATAEESIYAQALLTYEAGLNARPISEHLLNKDNPLMGDIYSFGFGEEIAVDLVPQMPDLSLS